MIGFGHRTFEELPDETEPVSLVAIVQRNADRMVEAAGGLDDRVAFYVHGYDGLEGLGHYESGDVIAEATAKDVLGV